MYMEKKNILFVSLFKQSGYYCLKIICVLYTFCIVIYILYYIQNKGKII